MNAQLIVSSKSDIYIYSVAGPLRLVSVGDYHIWPQSHYQMDANPVRADLQPQREGQATPN